MGSDSPAESRNEGGDEAELSGVRLDRLRGFRVRRVRDDSLAFLAEQFKHDVAKPFRQLEAVAAVWEALIEPALRQHCRLESLQHGVLTVTVDSSATLYQLDALVRGGLTVKLAEASQGKTLRRIKLRVDTAVFIGEPDDAYDGPLPPDEFEPDPETPR